LAVLPAVERGDAEVAVLARCELYHAERVAHAPARDHVSRECGDLLDVILGACRPRAIHDFLGGPPTERTEDARAQVPFRVVVAILVGPRVRHAQCLPTRDAGDAPARGCALANPARGSVTGLARAPVMRARRYPSG